MKPRFNNVFAKINSGMEILHHLKLCFLCTSDTTQLMQSMDMWIPFSVMFTTMMLRQNVFKAWMELWRVIRPMVLSHAASRMAFICCWFGHVHLSNCRYWDSMFYLGMENIRGGGGGWGDMSMYQPDYCNISFLVLG